MVFTLRNFVFSVCDWLTYVNLLWSFTQGLCYGGGVPREEDRDRPPARCPLLDVHLGVEAFQGDGLRLVRRQMWFAPKSTSALGSPCNSRRRPPWGVACTVHRTAAPKFGSSAFSATSIPQNSAVLSSSSPTFSAVICFFPSRVSTSSHLEENEFGWRSMSSPFTW